MALHINAMIGEATFETGGETLSLVMDNGAWVVAEDLLDQSMLEIVGRLQSWAQQDRPPRIGTMRALLWGATRLHHPEMTIDQCGDALNRWPDLHGALGKAISGSLTWRDADEGQDDSPGEAVPPKAAAKPARKPG